MGLEELELVWRACAGDYQAVKAIFDAVGRAIDGVHDMPEEYLMYFTCKSNQLRMEKDIQALIRPGRAPDNHLDVVKLVVYRMDVLKEEKQASIEKVAADTNLSFETVSNYYAQWPDGKRKGKTLSPHKYVRALPYPKRILVEEVYHTAALRVRAKSNIPYQMHELHPVF